jgi:hypothetical protein
MAMENLHVRLSLATPLGPPAWIGGGHQRDRDSRWEPKVSAFLIAPVASSLPPDLKLLTRVSFELTS